MIKVEQEEMELYLLKEHVYQMDLNMKEEFKRGEACKLLNGVIMLQGKNSLKLKDQMNLTLLTITIIGIKQRLILVIQLMCY